MKKQINKLTKGFFEKIPLVTILLLMSSVFYCSSEDKKNDSTGKNSNEKSASGTYIYDSQTNILSMNFTSTSFECSGPEVGTLEVEISLSASEMEWLDNPHIVWIRKSGEPNSIVGEWTTLSEDGNSYTLLINQDGTVVMEGTITQCDDENNDEENVDVTFTDKTIIIDGNFDDWSDIPVAVLDEQGDSTGGYDGDDIKSISVAKDISNYYFLIELYEQIILTFDGSFSIRINQPEGSSLNSYNQFFIGINYYNSEWIGNVYANPGVSGPDNLLGPDTTLIAVGSRNNMGLIEIKLPITVIGSPFKINEVTGYAMSYTSGDTDGTPSFNEK